MFFHRAWITVQFFSSICLCQQQGNTLVMNNGIKASEQSAMNHIDSIVGPLDASISEMNIACYFTLFNKSTVTFFTMTKKNVVNVIAFALVGDSITKRIEYQMTEKESGQFLKAVERYRPFDLKSVEDQLIDDGYTAIVKTQDSAKTNFFSVRAFSPKGKKSNQYKFVRLISKINSNNKMPVFVTIQVL